MCIIITTLSVKCEINYVEQRKPCIHVVICKFHNSESENSFPRKGKCCMLHLIHNIVMQEPILCSNLLVMLVKLQMYYCMCCNVLLQIGTIRELRIVTQLEVGKTHPSWIWKSCLLALKASHMFSGGTHVSYEPAGSDAVIVAHPALVIRVLPPHQNVLVAQVVRPLIENPGPTLHANRVTAAEVGVELRTVTVTLVVTTLEVFVFIKNDLEKETDI